MQHSDDPKRRAMVLTCYCDDSGSHEESTYAVVGGIVMDKRRYIGLHQKWYEILKEFRIDKIHMQDFVRPHGRYCTMSHEMKIALFNSVSSAILDFKFYSISAAVPQIELKRLLSEKISHEFMGAYALAFIAAYSANNYVGQATGYLNRMAYLIDKGSDHHHEQLNGAHTAILHAEKKLGWNFTGAMAADLDDHLCALQAADVIAWTHHRKLESQDFGDDFQPLLKLLDWKVSNSTGTTKLHIPMEVPVAGVEVFAKGVHSFIEAVGGLPSWEQIIANHVQAQVDDVKEIRN
jgi:hypothetical protein